MHFQKPNSEGLLNNRGLVNRYFKCIYSVGRQTFFKIALLSIDYLFLDVQLTNTWIYGTC